MPVSRIVQISAQSEVGRAATASGYLLSLALPCAACWQAFRSDRNAVAHAGDDARADDHGEG